MSKLTDMPAVVQDRILENLKLRDIFRFRLVCKGTNEWVKHSKVKERWGAVIPMVRRDFPGRNFRWVTTLPYFVTGITLHNGYLNDPDVYEDPYVGNGFQIKKFLKQFGSTLKSLHLSIFNACKTQGELDFLNSLSALEELVIDIIDLKTNAKLPCRIPFTFERLKVLTTDVLVPEKVSEDEDEDEPLVDYHWKLLQKSNYTRYLGVPTVIGSTKAPMSSTHPVSDYGYFMDIAKKRMDGIKESGDFSLVSHIDLLNVYDNYMVFDEDFGRLLEFCHEHGIRLVNVHARQLCLCAEFMGAVAEEEVEHYARLADCVIESVAGIDCPMKKLRLLNLKKLAICSTKEYDACSPNQDTHNWPNLKTLYVNFDSDSRCPAAHSIVMDLTSLVSLGGRCRWGDSKPCGVTNPELDDLAICFERRDKGDECSVTSPSVVQPSIIVKNFAHLTRLSICGWDEKNRSWLKLWKGLSLLEVIRIEDCRTLGNVGFIEDPKDPVFLKLKNLKILILGKLDKMPKITDMVFRDVFSKMSIEELYLRSDNPLSSITSQSIVSLAEGEFANSVQKFSFDEFSLEGVSQRERRKLEFLFRCNN